MPPWDAISHATRRESIGQAGAKAGYHPRAAPNNRVQATGNSLRSFFAPAISSA